MGRNCRKKNICTKRTEKSIVAIEIRASRRAEKSGTKWASARESATEKKAFDAAAPRSLHLKWAPHDSCSRRCRRRRRREMIQNSRMFVIENRRTKFSMKTHIILASRNTPTEWQRRTNGKKFLYGIHVQMNNAISL